MTEQYDKSKIAGAEGSSEPGAKSGPSLPGRRGVLMLGAVAASSVVTIRPALANTAGSVLNCKIPIPDEGHSGMLVGESGELVSPSDKKNAKNAHPGAPRPVTGEEAKQMIHDGLSPPGFDPNARNAYVNYITRLQRGTSGFTCYASLQMPR